MSTKFLIVPDDARADVLALLGLTRAQLGTLEHVLADKSVLRGAREASQTVAEKLAIEHSVALGVLSAIANIRRQREKFDLKDEELLQDFRALGSTNDDAFAAILAVLRRSDEEYVVEKVAALRHAVGPHLLDTRTVVEIRPIFSRDRSGIEGMFLLTYLELTTHQSGNNGYSTHTVQLSESDISELKEKLTDAELKLARLKVQFPDTEWYE